jgi:phosphoenolpyruvate carboxykinase (ATP)
MVRGALTGKLAEAPTTEDPVFGLHVPQICPGVPSEVLKPRDAWKDPTAYDEQAKKLASMFRENFTQFADDVSQELLAAGPR